MTSSSGSESFHTLSSSNFPLLPTADYNPLQQFPLPYSSDSNINFQASENTAYDCIHGIPIPLLTWDHIHHTDENDEDFASEPRHSHILHSNNPDELQPIQSNSPAPWIPTIEAQPQYIQELTPVVENKVLQRNSRRRKPSCEPWSLSKEERLLLELKNERGLPWREIAVHFAKIGKVKKPAAWQMQMKRMTERLEQYLRFPIHNSDGDATRWTTEDEKNLEDAQKRAVYWGQIAQILAEYREKADAPRTYLEQRLKELKSQYTGCS
ncbi:hypothetical protein TWF481_002743 [Arthrobotrys musiformis]|uniref:Myb-like domain-containing protein n=1 Tax=Arthrobotrys musiformis TaxID=47236 RepID=A0AAV9VR31_9PEZI